MSDTGVDVQKIMEEIKAEIAAKGLTNDIPSFEDVVFGAEGSSKNLVALKREIKYLKEHEVHYYRDITSYHKWLAPIVIFVKRVIRKLCKFIGEPAVNEINEYHRHIVKALEQTTESLAQISGSETQMLEMHRYKQLSERYATANYHMEKELEIMRQQMQQMQQQVELLKLQSERTELKTDLIKLKMDTSNEDSNGSATV